jgi:reverse gyrase
MTDRGDAHRADMRERMAIKRAAERNIELPPIVDMKRRAACLKSLAKFCRTYFPDIFCKPWSKNHRACIKKMEYAIRNGGQFCLALPRGEGKTVLSQAAALWAVLNGHRLYPVLIGATEPKAEKLLKDIKGMIRRKRKSCSKTSRV